MILRDTKINWRSYTQSASSEAVFNELSLLGFSLDRKSETQFESGDPHSGSTSATLWLLIFDNPAQMHLVNGRRHHALNEAFIYLFVDTISPSSKLAHRAMSVHQGIQQIAHALIEEEQVVLQRKPLQSPQITNDVFTQLNFYGRSDAFLDSISLIEYFAASEECIFVKGETGTGKEITARALHYLSKRKTAPFIPINCGAFTDELFLSELFGHNKGAFTGATKSKPGLLEIADQGTVFFDEVDALSAKAQVALLRFLQDSEIRPVGSNTIKKVDVRVVAASNRSIKQLIEKGEFREDLFYRLDVLSIQLPSLRQREEDVLLLAQYFLAQCALANQYQTKVFGEEIIQLMLNYAWPGNIRELENFVKRAYLMTQGRIIHYHHMNTEVHASEQHDLGTTTDIRRYSSSFHEEKQNLICKFEKDYLHQILSRTKGNISKAATIAKKERRSFCRLMKKHGLSRASYLST